MSRDGLIARFLAEHGYAGASTAPLAQDASFRRYLRIARGPRPTVLMDAPPPEDVRPFLRIAAHLAGIGLSVPDVIGADPDNGLVLEEDLGDALFSGPAKSLPTQSTLFAAAVDALVAIQRAAPPPDVPAWDAAAMSQATLGTLLDWWWPRPSPPPPRRPRATTSPPP